MIELPALLLAAKRVGFTGTRRGMTTRQKISVIKILKEFTFLVVHHGDCIGADADFDALCKVLKFRRIAHPSNLDTRAYVKADLIHLPKPALARNHDIVERTEFIIGCPWGTEEHLRSGTWATIRYARKREKPVVLVYPDGSASL